MVVAGANSMNAGHSNPGMHLGMGVAAGNAACLGLPGMHQVNQRPKNGKAQVQCCRLVTLALSHGAQSQL